MKLILDSELVRTHPAFLNPTRIGILAHLSALVAEEDRTTEQGLVPAYHVFLSPAALADTLTIKRSQVECAIEDLGKHGVLFLKKKTTKRGVWDIDLTPSKQWLAGGDTLETPKEVPIRDIMGIWDEAYKKATGLDYIRGRKDFWVQRTDFNALYQSLGDDIYVAIHRFFSDTKYAQWNYAFSVFFRSAPLLAKEPVRQGWRVQ